MGHKVYLVIEKMSEIAIVLDEAERLNVVPRLGVRARLASQGSVNGSPPAGKNRSSAWLPLRHATRSKPCVKPASLQPATTALPPRFADGEYSRYRHGRS
ncbi:hypothetical protein ACLB1M_22820 [Escherichia coli]